LIFYRDLVEGEKKMGISQDLGEKGRRKNVSGSLYLKGGEGKRYLSTPSPGGNKPLREERGKRPRAPEKGGTLSLLPK